VLVAHFDQNKNKQLKNVLRELLQRKLSDVVLTLPGLQLGDLPVHSIKKDQRKLLVRTLKDLRFPIEGTMGFEWSIVADGGVVPKEVDFRSMQSRLFPNLYLIGDTLHINRPSGGFSLQLCWTTGWVSGTHAATATQN
jgi:predicted flavoprotein YhiN